MAATPSENHWRSPSVDHWLRSHFFYPLAVMSIMALGLFVGWHFTDEPWTGPRLLWNLSLAWIPYLCSLGLVVLSRQTPNASTIWWVLFAVWLAFFPNAPYLVTDWLYLPHFQTQLWYSICLFMTFSLNGLLLTVISLYLAHNQLRVRVGGFGSGAVIALVFLLSGLGVYLGRFVRLNSWDLVTRPGEVYEDLIRHLNNPAYDTKPLYFTLGIALLLSVCYVVFMSLRNAPRSLEEIKARDIGTEGDGRT